MAQSWPLDSPISLGAGACFFLIFIAGLVLSVNPALLGARAGSRASIEDDKRMGRVLAYIFGPLSLTVLFLSWNRSNDERYKWM